MNVLANTTHKILRQVHPDQQITSLSTYYIYSLMKYILNNMLHEIDNGTTDINMVIDQSFGPCQQIAKHAKSDVDKYKNNNTVMTLSSLILKKLIKEITDKTYDHLLIKYIAITLEYLIAEILELAGNETHKRGKMRITEEDIDNAIQNDDELKTMFINYKQH